MGIAMATLSVERALAKAKSHVKKGEHREAQALYATILQAFPNNQKARQGLNTLVAGKNFAVEQDTQQTVIDKLVALYNRGQLEEVNTQAQSLIARYPRSVVLLNIMAASFAQIGKLEQAVIAFKKLIAINPNDPKSYNNMGNALKDQGKFEEALKAYNKAISLKPDYPQAYLYMGNALNNQSKLEEAIAAYNKAISLKPDYSQAYLNMGNSLNDQSKPVGAIEAYKKALAIQPDYAEASYNIGVVLADQGKPNAAIEAYTKALAIQPDYADAARNLVKLPIGSIDEKIILGLNKQFSILSPKIGDQSQRLFFKANVLSHNGKYDDAFKVFVEANRIKSNDVVFHVKKLTKKYGTVTKRIERWSPYPQFKDESSVKQLFLLGPSRSGKSSLEKLFIGIPNVCPMFENINLNTVGEMDSRRKEPNKLDMAEIFYNDEKSLLDNGHNLVISTSPESMFYVDHLLDGFVNSFCVLVERDQTDIASEIFNYEYSKENFYSYAHSSIQEYLNTYTAIWEEVKRKAPQRTLEIEYEDILTNPKEILEQISQFTTVKFQLDNVPKNSPRKKISPFREHYASRFKA